VRCFIVAFLALALVSITVGQASFDFTKVESRLADLHRERGFPGATVAVAWKDGRSKSFSVGNFGDGSKRALKPTDRMLAGSIGKTFVAATFLQIANEKGIELEDRVSRYLGSDAWFREIPNSAELTIRSLLNHTSGIPEHVQSKAFTDLVAKDPFKVWRHEELLIVTRGAKPLAAVGERFSYADTNYILLGLVLEKIAKRPMYALAEERFLKPLGLSRTMPSNEPKIADLAPGFATFGPFFARGSMVKDGKMVFNPQMEWCGGGFASTPTDLAKWAVELYGGKALSQKWKAMMLEGVSAGPLGSYGLGVQIRNTPIGKSLGHGGWFPGWLSEVEYFPDHGVAIAIQFNTDDFRQIGRSTHAILVELARIGLGKSDSR
jgi:D-alanyl-D-alanine carboxypeptidase